jgi:hypothetical protein
MTTCDITVPIRTIDALRLQPTGATCMRCGEKFTSKARGRGLTEQSCGCGLVYRVETLMVDSVVCGNDLAPANDSRFVAPRPWS